ncbi:hypothetical protein ABGB07_39830 [Micromonosporaceae bacterium B7E4]
MTGPMWVTLIVGVVGGLAGVAALLNAFFGRGKTKAEEAQIITGSAVQVMNEFQEDARAARVEAAEVRVEMRAVRDEARALAEELHRLRMAIMQPDATIEGLRALVSSGPGSSANGRPYP